MKQFLLLLALLLAACGAEKSAPPKTGYPAHWTAKDIETWEGWRAKQAAEQEGKSGEVARIVQAREAQEALFLAPGGLTAEMPTAAAACNNRGSFVGVATPRESAAIAASAGRARLEGDKLVVGRFTLNHDLENGDGNSYAYIGRYAGQPIDIVSATDGPYSWMEVLDQESGKKEAIGRLPIPSPSGEYWVFLTQEVPPDGRVEIRRRHKGWSIAATISAGDPCDVRWVGDHALQFVDNALAHYPTDPNAKNFREEMSAYIRFVGQERRIIRKGDAWVQEQLR